MAYISEEITKEIAEEIKKQLCVEVEASGRHIHLCRSDIDRLFGSGYQLTKVRDLSQPGQFVCKERLSVAGGKGRIDNVVILGPERKETQVELSLTDARLLGVDAPVRQSGDIQGTPGCTLIHGDIRLEKATGVIVAKRHIHMTPEDAARFHITDGEVIKMKVFGKRPLIFGDLVARVSKNFRTYVHIDYDEANACGHYKGALGLIVK